MEVSLDKATHGISRGFPTQFTVNLSGQSDREVTIPLVVTYGEDVSPGDVTGIPERLTFSPNQSRPTFQVGLSDDEFSKNHGTVDISFGDLPLGISTGVQARTGIILRGDDVWHTMMTVGNHEGALGYRTTEATTTGALTDSDFVWRDSTYTVNSVLLHQDGTVSVDFTPSITDPPDTQYLALGNMRLNLADGQVNDRLISWRGERLDWETGASVRLLLKTFKDSMEVRSVDGRINNSGNPDWAELAHPA